MAKTYEEAVQKSIDEMNGRTRDGKAIVVGHGLCAIAHSLLAVAAEIQKLRITMVELETEKVKAETRRIREGR